MSGFSMNICNLSFSILLNNYFVSALVLSLIQLIAHGVLLFFQSLKIAYLGIVLLLSKG